MGHKLLWWLAGLITTAVLVMFAYFYLATTWSYSEGERAGYLQKFSYKGWVCKTYEGEIAMSTIPGSAPTIWRFTVRDKAVATQLQQHLGQPVTLHYKEHLGIPTSCYGETNYFVTRVLPR